MNKSILPAMLAKLAPLACLFVAPMASAQSASHEATSVKSGSYQIDPSHTQVGFALSHFGFSYYSGVFSNVSGTLDLDPSSPTSSKLDVTIPIASVMTTSSKLDGELKGPEWFDAGKFSNATFVSTKVTPMGKNAAKVTGSFTLHGVTKPETLTVHFVGAGMNPLDKKYTVGFEATGMVKRSEFGVKTYVPLVGDEVKLTIAGAFELQG